MRPPRAPSFLTDLRRAVDRERGLVCWLCLGAEEIDIDVHGHTTVKTFRKPCPQCARTQAKRGEGESDG